MAEPIDPDLPTGAVAGRRGGASRFLCDEMLGRLARYLRAAGYDTVLAAGGLPDSVWIGLAHREARLLLTCDRALAQGRHARDLIVNLEQGDLDRQAEALRKQCGVDWLWRPFSRCQSFSRSLSRSHAYVAMERLYDAMEHGGYDLVVLDTPPVGVVSDALMCASVSTGVIYVVRAGKTKRSMVKRSLRLLSGRGAPLLGLVVNRLDFRRAESYYGEYQPDGVSDYAATYKRRTRKQSSQRGGEPRIGAAVRSE